MTAINVAKSPIGPIDSSQPYVDFTPIFEDAILTIIPAGLLLCSPKIVSAQGSYWRTNKLVILTVLAGLQVTSLALIASCPSSASRSSASTSGAALLLAAGVALVTLSFLEHTNTVRPSPVIEIYLLLSLPMDIVKARTLWMNGDSVALAVVSTIAVAAKLVALISEAVEKRNVLLARYRAWSPGTTSGVYGRRTFWWLSPLLWSGFDSILVLDDLYPVDIGIGMEFVHAQLKQRWAKKRHGESKEKNALLQTTLVSFRWPLLRAVSPRLCATLFQFMQPFLITAVIKFLQEPVTPRYSSVGWALTAAYGLDYLGLAICNSYWQHETYRMVTVARGGITSVIYSQTVSLDLTSLDESAAVTLMSADTERIMMALQYVHGLWASPLDTAIGVYLLQRHIGLACLGPALLLRVEETRMALRFRCISTMRLSFGKRSEILGPGLAFAAYAAVSKATGTPLDAAKTYSSLNIVSLMRINLGETIQNLQTILSTIGCFDRIQDFLNLPSRQDHRLEDGGSATLNGDRFEIRKPQDQPQPTSREPVLRLESASFSWITASEAVINDISIVIVPNSLNFIVGPVGSGKSTFLKGLMGEVAVTKGFVYSRTGTAGLVDQTSWIQNGTVRSNILGQTPYHQSWYDAVMYACALTEDMAYLPRGDRTGVGSAGINLSGGQKQRIAMARAVYSREKLLLLDDCFSGLDSTTEDPIFDRLLEKMVFYMLPVQQSY
ncbi:hypothetical protein K431DRAFT_297243 [Polychaeton citri CBS 116435]|uniref:ABC transporter domain-containing protein n=1 Tax=Polychaeton citri CBS 116435 TaxID=1314669 RepID=A0A9P4UJK1_9PEZI|nr:hypothetical protein K431DRAFT_297243 [Polychaeton citri CBS 116435]